MLNFSTQSNPRIDKLFAFRYTVSVSILKMLILQAKHDTKAIHKHVQNLMYSLSKDLYAEKNIRYISNVAWRMRVRRRNASVR